MVECSFTNEVVAGSNPVAMTRRGSDIWNDYIGKQCLDVLGMWHAAVDEGEPVRMDRRLF